MTARVRSSGRVVTEVDVLVIGSGLTAMLLAHELLRHGVTRVRVIGPTHEHAIEGLPVLRADTVAALAEAGLHSMLASTCRPLRRVLVRHDGPGAWEDEAVPVQADTGLAAGPVLADPDAFGQALSQRVRSLGGEYTGLVSLLSLEGNTDGGGVTVQLEHHGLANFGEREAVCASFVVRSSGDGGVVQAATGLSLVPDEACRRVVLEGRAELGRRLVPGTGCLWIGAGGHVTLLPLNAGLMRVTASVPDTGAAEWWEPVWPVLRATLRRSLGEGEGGDGRLIHVGQEVCPGRGAALRLRAGRVLLAGDAAHRTARQEGRDMSLGIHDTLSLAPHLAAVLAGTAPDDVLDTWAQGRQAAARDILRLTDAGCERALAEGQLDAAGALVLGHRAVPAAGESRVDPHWRLVPPGDRTVVAPV